AEVPPVVDGRLRGLAIDAHAGHADRDDRIVAHDERAQCRHVMRRADRLQHGREIGDGLRGLARDEREREHDAHGATVAACQAACFAMTSNAPCCTNSCLSFDAMLTILPVSKSSTFVRVQPDDARYVTRNSSSPSLTHS